MGAFKELMDVISDLDIQDAAKDYQNTKRYSSISKMASDGIMQFPVLVTRSLPIDTLQMITKALERNYATFVQVAITMNSTMDISQTKNPAEFVRKFHQNLSGKVFNPNDLLESLSGLYECFENDHLALISAVYEGSTGTIVAKNKEQLVDLMEHVCHDVLNDKYVPKSEVIYHFRNPELSAKYNSVTEAKGKPTSNSSRNSVDHIRIQERQLDQNERQHREKLLQQMQSEKMHSKIEGRKIAASIANNRATQQFNNSKLSLDWEKFDHQKEVDDRNFKHRFDDAVLAQNVLKDNDVKKANELVATTLHISVKQINEENEDVGIIDFIIGVKATMHPINTQEMVVNMVSACKNNNKAFNFLRWTTGEISFFKDFLFGVKEIKSDIVNRSAGASSWWLALKRRRALSKFKAAIFTNDRILPNASIVLSIEEVERIKSEYGYDLFTPVFIKKIMQTYFLLGFVIVDSSAQIAHFMFDGKDDFESVSFGGLEKENSADERKFKEMLKVINRN